MYKNFHINKPFFEIGPKVYIYGQQAVDLAKFADELCEKYCVDIIFTAQYTDISSIARETRNIHVFAQHMDSLRPGRGIGAVLPEAIKYAGAVGVLLNHAEKPLTLSEINKTIQRADEVGLATLVCAGTPEESAAVACLSPNIVLAESPKLIGKGKRSLEDKLVITEINRIINKINPEISVLHAAGISNENDVYEIIAAGADGTGSTSGIIKAENPFAMLERMIQAVRRAWDERNNIKQND